MRWNCETAFAHNQTGRCPRVRSLTLADVALAHKHQEELSDEQAKAPVDALLWMHKFFQAASWGVLFPMGMVLGITRSRWCVPVQVSMAESGYNFSLWALC
jgi:hypothetical protein